MVTNQIIKRPMGMFEVEQRTKDGMFNATAFVNQWNDIHKSSVNISDIINDYNDFCKKFISSDGCVSGISKEDGYWVDEFTFRNILNSFGFHYAVELQKGYIKSRLFKRYVPYWWLKSIESPGTFVAFILDLVTDGSYDDTIKIPYKK